MPRLPTCLRHAAAVGPVVLAGAVVLAACGGSTASTPTTTPPTTAAAPTSVVPTSAAPTTSPTTTSPTTVAPTTTTTVVPADPQPSTDGAAQALVNAWEQGDRHAAAQVGTPAAVRSLFERPYGGGVIQDRGCATPGLNPVVCTFGPYGGASTADPIYEITVTPARGAWYVSGVRRLG